MAIARTLPVGSSSLCSLEHFYIFELRSFLFFSVSATPKLYKSFLFLSLSVPNVHGNYKNPHTTARPRHPRLAILYVGTRARRTTAA